MRSWPSRAVDALTADDTHDRDRTGRAAGPTTSWRIAGDRVSLGPNILRVETAAVAAAALSAWRFVTDRVSPGVYTALTVR